MSRSLRDTFDEVAERYDAARPRYPDELYDDLIALAGVAPGAALLEVGCGTGKATRPLLERGFRVTCVELGPHLAEQARRNLAGLPVEVHVAPFEEWSGPAASFDLVFPATAWHWLDPAVRFARAHALLRPGGSLAVWSASHAFPAGFDPFFTEIQDVYDELGESYPGGWPPPPPDETPDEAERFRESGLFAEPELRRYVWARRYTADEYIALLETFSGHVAMGEAKRERLAGEIRRRLALRDEPTVLRHWQAILHVARRLESDPARQVELG